jgi:hypothetical protein
VRYRAGIYRTKPLERRKTRMALLFLYGSNPMLIAAVFLFKTVLDQRGGVPKGNLIHYFLSFGYTVIKPIRKEEDFGFISLSR